MLVVEGDWLPASLILGEPLDVNLALRELAKADAISYFSNL